MEMKSLSTWHHRTLILWYILFGALHECFHVLTALLVGSTNIFLEHQGIVHLLFSVTLGRHVVLPGATDIAVVRHVGWITSLAILLILRHSNCNSKEKIFAAGLTALEAIWTDLFQWKVLPAITAATPAESAFFCGNFGIILLHHLWLTDQSAALDVLEKMVQVTMMRGAQSGGVVAYYPVNNNTDKAIRRRVVNKKRADLSKVLRRVVQRDVLSKRFPADYVPVLLGHTRFATSSKATLQGTHPHQWTPASYRRVYNFNVPNAQMEQDDKQFVVVPIKVGNYITHNGDFEFYTVNGKTYDVEVIQKWLVAVTGIPLPALVDSVSIAGMIDLLRTQGCFGLSARYAICLGLPTSKIEDELIDFPSYSHFENIGILFEQVFAEMIQTTSFATICESAEVRHSFALRVLTRLEAHSEALVKPLERYITDHEGGASLLLFCLVTIDAFFDNNLLHSTQTFLKHAKGSFGLCITSSLDAHCQICLAARGQTMSVAFYPSKALICFGSEQAAVKAGMNVEFPGKESDILGQSQGDIDNDALRLDLDDLGGEVIVLDWGSRLYKKPPVSRPSHSLVEHEVMNGKVVVFLSQTSKATSNDPQLYHRMTRLTRNHFIQPLREESKDIIRSDIQDIPRVCKSIQDEWRSDRAATSLNRLTAYNLSRCLRDRLDAHVAGTVHSLAIDILLTGCEVSLWLAEQMSSDLQKAFPRLRVKALSSNKLLGLYGQEISVPSIGFPYNLKTYSIRDAIVIIVSHSGGTFGPLSCSNLLQSLTKNIFVVTSEWDTQIGKQLRAMDKDEEDHIFNSRIFSTEVGMRPAEPCSVSVAATHQLLTNLFEYLCALILSNSNYRRVTCAAISEQDLSVLETCNRMNIDALTEIVGADEYDGVVFPNPTVTESQLRAAGDLWAEHVLENAKAYIITFIYIFATVIAGFPIFSAIACGVGLNSDSDWFYLVRLFDAALYFWLPQVNITLLRLLQGRNIYHRMVGRTVVIGDIPWVAQCAEAFLSKIFAVSYSIAGLNVLSGNPADHFVHRHTHRVVRGSLVICGRPDGRLSALSTAEAAVCLSVNQASSIQSLGGSCESITIGHNPFKLALTERAIFLKRKRPLFLCERLLVEDDVKQEKPAVAEEQSSCSSSSWFDIICQCLGLRRSSDDVALEHSFASQNDPSIKPRARKRRSATALIGAYINFEEDKKKKETEGVKEDLIGDYLNFEDDTKKEQCPIQDVEDEAALSVDEIIATAVKERKFSDKAKALFEALLVDGNNCLSEDDFIKGSSKVIPELSEEEARQLFAQADYDQSGHLDYDQFSALLRTSNIAGGVKLPPSNRDERGIIQIQESREKYFGEKIRNYNAGKAMNEVDFSIARSQTFAMELYESRIASLQRFVGMTVMFHQMGKRVQDFFASISFGLLGYRMDRTHSIMRIASTASPVSGSDVMHKMPQLALLKKVQHSIHVIETAYFGYKAKKEASRVKELSILVNEKEVQHSIQIIETAYLRYKAKKAADRVEEVEHHNKPSSQTSKEDEKERVVFLVMQRDIESIQ